MSQQSKVVWCRLGPLAAFGGMGLFATPAAAHGFGQRFDLPLPLWFWIIGAGATVGLSFVVAAIFMRESAANDYPRTNLDRFAVTRGLTHPLFIAIVRALAAAFFLFVLYAGFAGTQDPYGNIIVTTIWIIWWVGVAFACALIGDFWRLINPLNTIFMVAEGAISGLTKRRISLDLVYLGWLGAWPAVFLFLVFAWSELVWQTNDVPRELSAAMLTYACITWAGMILFGREAWLRHGEIFSLAFGLFARFSPLEYREPDAPGDRGSLYLRPYAVGLLDRRGIRTSFVVFVLLMLSTVTFDGFVETAAFRDTLNEAYQIPALVRVMYMLSEYGISDAVFLMTIWLVLFPLGFVLVYFLGSVGMVLCARGSWETPVRVREAACAFILTLVPIAIAYHLAHYLQFLFTSGQFVVPLASDPLGRGWDLFGTAGYEVNFAILNPYFVWYSATLAIVVGHVLSVYLAHVVAMRLFGTRKAALLSQVPMVILMICYTMLSFWIMAQPIVG